MQRSAAQAAAATSRPMEITDFAGDAVIQTTPTGRYGVVYFSFNWKNFAKTVPDLAIGDAFAGGLYLAKDNTLVIRYPSGYSVSVQNLLLIRCGTGLSGTASVHSGQVNHDWSLKKPAFPGCRSCWGVCFACSYWEACIWFCQKDGFLNPMRLRIRRLPYPKRN